MDKEVKYQGVWYLPDQPKNRVPGTFTFTPSTGVLLELEGELPIIKGVYAWPFHPSLIVGIANSGEYIYIINCISIYPKYGDVIGNGRSKLKGEIAFTGKHKNAVHFNDTEQLHFRRLSIHYANLDEWLAESMTDGNIEEGAFSQGYSVAIRKQVSIKEKAFIEIAFEESKSLDDCFDYISHLRNFLTLGLSVPTYPLQVSGQLDTEEKIDFLYSQLHLPAEIKPINSDNILFTFPNIQDNFQSYLGSWFKQAERLQLVYDLYFSTRYNPYEYLQSKFLSLTQALEAYHRRQYGGVYLDTKAYKQNVYPKLVEAIPPDLESDFKDSLKDGTLKYAYQFPLRKRLKDMTTELANEDLGITFLNTGKAQNDFVKKVVDTRNYLTHYDPDPDSRVDVSSEKLLDLIEKMGAILEIYLLKEIGFDFDLIRQITREHWKYQSIFRRGH